MNLKNVGLCPISFGKIKYHGLEAFSNTQNRVQVTVYHTAQIQIINKVLKKWFILQCHQTLYSISRGNINSVFWFHVQPSIAGTL